MGLPLATAVKQVSVSSGGVTASLEQKFISQATANNGLYAQYTVKIDNAGLISGFGLASTNPINATPSSAFGVRANRFYVSDAAVAQSTAPTGTLTEPLYDGYVWLDTSVTPSVTRFRSGASWVLEPTSLPFVVQSRPTQIDGLKVAAGVYIDSAIIKNASIVSAQIASVRADSIKSGFLDAVVSQTGAIYNGVNAYTLTKNAETGVVTANATGQTPGTAGFGTGYYLGTLNGSPQMFVGSPSNYMLWNGGALTVRGTVYATAGSFAGDISAATGSFRGGVQGGEFTSYNWPTSGAGGYYLGGEGLLMGNYYTGKYFQVTADGNVYAPGFSIVNGNAAFSGTLTAANMVNTSNIVSNAVTVPMFGGYVDSTFGNRNSYTAAQYFQAGQSLIALGAYTIIRGGTSSGQIIVTVENPNTTANYQVASSGNSFTNSGSGVAVGYFTIPEDGYYLVFAKVTANEAGGYCSNCSITAFGARK